MATESWTVAIPGELTFKSGSITPPTVTTNQKSSIYGHRYAEKTRVGNWDRKRPKILEPTPYVLSNTVIRSPKGKTILMYPQWNVLQSYEGDLQMGLPSWESMPVIDSLRNEALIDALQRLKDQKFNAGVAMAEASGLANMAGDVMDFVSKVRRDFLRKDLKAAYERFRRHVKYMSWEQFRRRYPELVNRQAHLSRVPNSWTYYHFGIKPTIQDIANAHEDWYRQHTVPGAQTWKNVVRGQAKRVESKSGAWQTSHYCHTPDMTMNDVESMRVYLTVTPMNEFLSRLSQMGATNVPEAAWNGVAFSWVVDYFTSFGDWLSVLDAGMGYQFGSTVESYRRITRYECYSYTVNPSGGVKGSTSATPFKGRKTVLNRRVVAEMYPPMFRVLPRAKIHGPSMRKFANMLSVLPGLFGRGTPPVRI